MKRSEFLKSLGFSSVGLFSPRGLAENWAICIYDNYLTGLLYYDMKRVGSRIVKGDEVCLKHEASNPHDAFAVEVFWQKHKLGYLPAFENVVLANMLGQGLELRAFVSEKAMHPNFQFALDIEVYAHLLEPGKSLQETEQKPGRADNEVDNYRNSPRTA